MRVSQGPQFNDHPEVLQELNLDVSTEEFLSAERAFTYADLYATLGNEETVEWLTPHAAVALKEERVVQAWRHLHGATCYFNFNADGKEIVARARSHEHLLEICDVIVRVLAASVVYSVDLKNFRPHDGAWISAPTLGYLMEQCQSLNMLTLVNLKMDQNHCRVVGVYSRTGLEIE
jgi:hypothetical protein